MDGFHRAGFVLSLVSFTHHLELLEIFAVLQYSLDLSKAIANRFFRWLAIVFTRIRVLTSLS
jgi:hypothetical protein